MNEVEEIKAKIDIVDLLSNYLTLKKAGANWKSICPFHQEKTPSLMVSREKQIFKCFGCGAGGDIFEFIKLIEHLEFPEALKLLAERCGVTLEKRKPLPGEAPDQKTKLFQINDLSARFFHKILLDHPVGQEALNYLKIRKINPQTIKNFLLGYAPQKEVLGNWLRTKGFTTQEIAQAGSPDRFRNRLIFPITNPLSKVIAFTGRILNPHDQPKYLNTPDTPIFHKSHVLYGLEKAKMAIKEKDQVILVEGQMDVISSYQAGITNVVASSGTALTEEHLKILSRYTPNIVFAFDQDSAGTEASKRAIDLAIKQDFNVRLAFLREVKDPGEAIEKDPQIFIEAIKQAKRVIEWYFELAFGVNNKESQSAELRVEDKKKIARELLPIIAQIPDQIERAHYQAILSERLQVSLKSVEQALNKYLEKQTGIRSKPVQSTKPSSSEETLIGLLVAYADQIKEEYLSLKDEDFTNLGWQKVYLTLKKWYNSNKGTNLEKFLNDELDPGQFKKVQVLDFETKHLFHDDEEAIKAIQDLVKRLHGDAKEKRKILFAQRIAQAEKSGDRAKVKELVKEYQELLKTG